MASLSQLVHTAQLSVAVQRLHLGQAQPARDGVLRLQIRHQLLPAPVPNPDRIASDRLVQDPG